MDELGLPSRFEVIEGYNELIKDIKQIIKELEERKQQSLDDVFDLGIDTALEKLKRLIDSV